MKVKIIQESPDELCCRISAGGDGQDNNYAVIRPQAGKSIEQAVRLFTEIASAVHRVHFGGPKQSEAGRMRLQVPSDSQRDAIVELLQLKGYEFHDWGGGCLYISVELKKFWRSTWTTGDPYLDVNENNLRWVLNCFS